MELIYFIICLFLFSIYIPVCLILSLIKFGKVKKGSGREIYTVKDLIHTDYLFESKDFKGFFEYKKKYLKIGWGDKKIFLETKDWKDLKYIDVLFAFLGINKSVLRVEHIDSLPVLANKINVDEDQLTILINHVKNSTNKILINNNDKKGDYYESNLNYNCITNCNNWINLGFRKAKISNRLWSPLVFWL